jgi:hypothetical protein
VRQKCDFASWNLLRPLFNKSVLAPVTEKDGAAPVRIIVRLSLVLFIPSWKVPPAAPFYMVPLGESRHPMRLFKDRANTIEAM